MFATLNRSALIHRGAALTIYYNIKTLGNRNPYAIYDLFDRCFNPKSKITKNPIGDSEKILKERGLLQENGSVHEEVQKIVKNVIEINSKGEVFIAPLSLKEVTLQSDRI